MRWPDVALSGAALLLMMTLAGHAAADDPARLRETLLDLEKQSWELVKRQDVAALRDFLPDDYVEILGDGTRLPKAELLKVLPDLKIHSYSIGDDVDVMALSADVATLVFTVKGTSTFKGSEPASNTTRSTSTYVRRNGQWRNVLYQESPVVPPEQGLDTRGLDEALHAWEAAFNAHDAKALGALYTDDARCVLPDGKRLEGRAAIEKEYAETFARNPRVKTKLTVIAQHAIKPDIAIEDGSVDSSDITEGPFPPQNHYTTILIERDGKWLAAGDRSYVLTPKRGAE